MSLASYDLDSSTDIRIIMNLKSLGQTDTVKNKMDTIDEEMDIFDQACFAVECDFEGFVSSVSTAKRFLTQTEKKLGLATSYVKLTNVSPELAKLKLRKSYRHFYDPRSRIMIITIPGPLHEAANGAFSTIFLDSTRTANIQRRAVQQLSTARVQGHFCAKEPDNQFRPTDLLNTTDLWPTVVLEVGVSESQKKLRADANWWLANGEGKVKLVITIAVNTSVPELIFESVELDQPLPVLRNNRIRYQTRVRQKITVSKPPGGDNSSIRCDPDTSLNISCQELLGRPPVPPETDPDISPEGLKDIGWFTWLGHQF
jgi:hypothetical protein